MPNLTDADKKTFIGEIKNALTGNKDILIAGNPEVPGSSWDPTQRVAALKAGEQAVEGIETTIANLEVALKSAVDSRRTALERNYDLASASVSSVEGCIGKDHTLSTKLHQLRGSYSQAPAAPASKPSA
jgi:hypothetical protein